MISYKSKSILSKGLQIFMSTKPPSLFLVGMRYEYETHGNAQVINHAHTSKASIPNRININCQQFNDRTSFCSLFSSEVFCKIHFQKVVSSF